MSTDRSITNELLQTLEDGRNGYRSAAERLDDSDRADLAATFREYEAQRTQFVSELESLAAIYGDEIEADGSTLAAVHRGWMALKDLVTGSDVAAIVEVAIQGEEHAVGRFREALTADISDNLKTVAQRQLLAIEAAQQDLSQLLSSARS